MFVVVVGPIVLVAIALLVAYRFRGLNAVGGKLLAAGVLLAGGVWCVWMWPDTQPVPANVSEPPLGEDPKTWPTVRSEVCAECHQPEYASWHRSFHRTMTREATPEDMKATFDGTDQRVMGAMSRMTRVGDRYAMETVDPQWSTEQSRRGVSLEAVGPGPRREFTVDRIVGSHWFQQFLHLDEFGRYIRLPLAYHIVEKRWIHVSGAFLTPETASFFDHGAVWNEVCVRCHNTRSSKNPQPLSTMEVESPSSAPTAMPVNRIFPGYRTEVGELGIACEACHSAGARHVRTHRSATRSSGEPDAIVNPSHLSIPRADDVCANCHSGQMVPRQKEWDPLTLDDPYRPGRDLKQFFHPFWSEVEQRFHVKGQETTPRAVRPEPTDGRFWGDGTPLTTALEYQGMALSACYQNGTGKMSCLSCHSMHQSEPNHQLKEGMRTNAACYSCHPGYRDRLVQHTHHPADSQGSLCFNCHMPHQVYSLLDTHRSHRIAIPRVKDSLGTGKPHACNLCHLDKSLGWTQDQLGKWYATKPEPLAPDERTLASSLLHLATSDARSRAVVAGAFAWPPAQQASGRDWPVMLLTRTLEQERFPAVRFTAHKALRSLHGAAANDYAFQGSPAQRAAQMTNLRRTLENAAHPDPSRYPYLPFTIEGRFDQDVYNRLLRTRNDPNVLINE